MLDFFKDMYAEINGLDLEVIKKERRVKQEKYDKIMQRAGKVVIVIVGVLYLVLAGTNISIMIDTGFDISIIKYIILSLIDIATLTTFFIKNKSANIARVILMSLFIFLNFALINL